MLSPWVEAAALLRAAVVGGAHPANLCRGCEDGVAMPGGRAGDGGCLIDTRNHRVRDHPDREKNLVPHKASYTQ